MKGRTSEARGRSGSERALDVHDSKTQPSSLAARVQLKATDAGGKGWSISASPTIRRWGEVTAYALIGAAMMLLLAPLAAMLLKTLGSHIPKSWGEWPGLSALGVLILSIVAVPALREWARLPNLLRYPPAWIGGCLGAVLLLAFAAWRPQAFPPEFVAHDSSRILAVVAVSILGIPLALALARRRAGSERTIPTARRRLQRPVHSWDFATLQAWLRTDLPVDATDQDLFGHAQIAHRIYRRLSRESEAQTVALVGPFGSGKTTIRRLVEHSISSHAPGSIELIAISVWPFETSEAAVRGIIERIVEALAKHVSPLSIRGLGQEYLELIATIDGRVGKLVNLSTREPAAIVRHLGSIAKALSLRICLWIEDLERFAGTESSPRQSAERLSPIRALLHLLDEQSYLTVVVASTNLDARFDVEKIARFVETIPALAPQEQHRVLRTFRDGCLKAGNFIDAASPEQRAALAFSDDSLRRLRAAIRLDASQLHPSEALCLLCGTPRTLKQGLRECFETWQVLGGEVDFDDALALSLLKAAMPAVFSLLIARSHELRLERWQQFAKHKSGEDAVADLKRAVSSATNHRQRVAWPVVEFLFDPGNESQPRPQGVKRTSPRDYLARFLSVPELANTERDQVVLQAMDGFSRKRRRLAEWLCNDRMSHVVVHFHARLTTPQVFELVDLALTRLTKRRNPRLREGNTLSSMRNLLIFREHELDELILSSTLTAHIRNAIGNDLVLASALAHYFATWHDGGSNFFRDPSASRNLATTFWESLAQTYSGKPDLLAEVLGRGDRWTLLQCCIFDGRTVQSGAEPSTNWASIANTVLEATDRHPSIMLPQIATLVFDYNRSRHVLKPDRIRQFFDYEAFARVFTETQRRFPDDPTVDRMLRMITEAVSQPDFSEIAFEEEART